MDLLSIPVSPLVTVQMRGATADIRVHQSGPASSRPVAPASVGWKLVRPELSPHLSYLVASLLAFWIGNEHVIVPPVGEHLEHLGGGLLEEPDRREVFQVLAAQRRRGLQSVKSGLSRLVAGESFLHSGAELGPTEILPRIEDLPEAHSHRASLDIAVDRPELADVLLFGSGEGRPARFSRPLGGRRRRANARFAVERQGHKAGEACEN